MQQKNIDYMLQMTRDFLTGVIDPISYDLDFSYEIELRFKAMRREHRELADLVYDNLYEDGIAKKHENNLSDDAFKKLIRKQYNDINRIMNVNFLEHLSITDQNEHLFRRVRATIPLKTEPPFRWREPPAYRSFTM